MNYLPQLKEALLDAARRRSEERAAELSPGRDATRRSRAWGGFGVLRAAARRGPWRMRGWRGVAVNVALTAVLALGGLTASGAFERGPTVGPELKPTPSIGVGAAIQSSVELLPIRTPDPAGGLPWGLRLLKTNRGATCVEVGRVDFGTVGVLGVDGLLHNDGRFHPLSTAVYDPMGCANTDASGHAFLNVVLEGVPMSGVTGDTVAEGCRPVQEGAAGGLRVASGHLPKAIEEREQSRPVCAFEDLREIYYGLLGPEAVSITYRTAEGGMRTIPTTGPDGAYLVVLRQSRNACGHVAQGVQTSPCQSGLGSVRGGPDLLPGAIASVTYRDGHTCHVPERSATPWRGDCPPVGYVPHTHTTVTRSAVASAVEVQRLSGRSFCEKRGPIPDDETETTKPCGAQVPRGYERIVAPSELIRLSFTARVAVKNDRGEYSVYYRFPRTAKRRPGCNDGGGMGTSMNFDIREGQRLSETRTFPLGCPGVIRGTVTYITRNGPGGLAPAAEARGKRFVVGRFEFYVP